MNYKHLIYDFDGTLSDTYPCFTESILQTLKDHGLSDTYESVYAKLKVSVGYTVRCYDFGKDSAEVRKHFHKIHDELAPKIQKPYPEAEEILRYAMAQGHKNYLYTHSGKIVKILLEQWGIADCFEDIIDSTMSFPTKPAPDALNYLCEKHGLDKKDCIMIGDSDIDTDCGRNAGMKGCLFDPEHYYDNADVDYRIENLLELKNII
ncbi:MAG: HAD-IA family hydrolase [Clostridia bacterium]|nr:HAD-IA family hydrolase [Clostridia bacterium]